MQCVSAVGVALLAIELGTSFPAKIVGAAGGALITAFLIAPGPHRHRRVVAVSIGLALVATARSAAAAAASKRRRERPRHRDAVDWAGCVPGSWAGVGIAAAVGLGGAGSEVGVGGAPLRVAAPLVGWYPTHRGWCARRGARAGRRGRWWRAPAPERAGPDRRRPERST
jgi:hypothetical protein